MWKKENNFCRRLEKANYNGIFQKAVQEMINDALMYLAW